MNPKNPKATWSSAKLCSLIIKSFLVSMGLLMSCSIFADPHPKLPSLPNGYGGVLNVCGNSGVLQWEPCLYEIGNTGPAGGIVFYVTDNGMHGLEAARVDQSTGAAWCSSESDIDGVDNIALSATPDSHSGAHNTPLIAAVCGASSAAGVAADYDLNGYTDWFLPNKEELNLLYQQRNLVGGFAETAYWSSTEYDSESAWYQDFFNPGGLQVYWFKSDSLPSVRAVRAF